MTTIPHHPQANSTMSAPNIPLPVGAVFGDDWADVGTNTGPWRTVAFISHQVTDHQGRVSLTASQDPSGHLDEFQIEASNFEYNSLNSDQARELAAVLLEAADEMDGWAAR
jgi:hypothetical protein